MQAAGLAFALALPILIGVALLAACVRDASQAREAGLAPWILGAGYVVGAFVLTLLMRGIAVTGTPLDLVSIGVPGLAIAGALSWLAWRRSATGWRDAMTDARRTLIASDLARPRRPVHSSTSSSRIAISRTSVPAAIASCGIHSGVASLPVEMSLNCHDWNASRML